MSDETLRAAERAVLAGDEARIPELRRLYERDGGEALASLRARLEAHVGRDLFPCANLVDGACTFLQDDYSGELGRPENCPRCDGTGREGPLGFTRGILGADYKILENPDYKGHATARNAVALIESISIAGNRYRPQGITPITRRMRGHLAIVTRCVFWIASCDAEDWVGHQLLSRWLQRPSVLDGKIATRDLAALGATREPGPLVALWALAGDRRPASPAELENRGPWPRTIADLSVESRAAHGAP